MPKDINWPIVTMVLTIGSLVVFVALVVYAIMATSEFDVRCRARGGEPVHIYKSRPLCLRPGSIINAEAP